MKKLRFILFVTLLLFSVTACNNSAKKEETKEDENSKKSAEFSIDQKKVFVTADWVKELIDGKHPESENYIIAEVGWRGLEYADAYKKEHIPGAIYINTDEVEYPDFCDAEYDKTQVCSSDGIDDLTGEAFKDPNETFNLRSADELANFLKSKNITQDTVVVLYGGSGYDSGNSRVAFSMLYAGVKNVKILDGGKPAWGQAGYEYETKVNQPTEGSSDYDFGTTIPAHPEYVMSIETVKDKLENDPNFRLISIRSLEEFTGVESGYTYISAVGEPAGAVWGHNIVDYGNGDGTIVDIRVLESYLKEANSSLENELAFYCGTGWRATIPFLMCYEKGMDNVYLFDGGWYQWQLDSKNPVQAISPEEAAEKYEK